MRPARGLTRKRRPALIKQFPDLGSEVSPGKGCDDDLHTGLGARPGLQVVVGHARHEQHPGIRPSQADPLSKHDAVHPRHDDVHQQQIDGSWMMFDDVQCFAGVMAHKTA